MISFLKRAALSIWALSLIYVALAPQTATARDQIRIVGSSTVYPFSTAVAEEFGRTSGFPSPIVESTGTGGGLKLFCSGVGDGFPDIANASRAIKSSEVNLCAQNGVNDITEIRVGFDGIVIANDKSAPQFKLTLPQLFLALAKQVPNADGTALIDNPYTRWNEIDPSLPGYEIEVLGPPPTSGTRDAFVELAMESGCDSFAVLADLKATDSKAHKAKCTTLREDGRFVEAGENDNLIIQKLQANTRALGIFGFSFLEQNQDVLQAATIDGKTPSFSNIADGNYPVSRSLYIYVKDQHIPLVTGLSEYVSEYVSETAFGRNGYLASKGLIPLPDPMRMEMRAKAEDLALLIPETTDAGMEAVEGLISPTFGWVLILALGTFGFFLSQSRAGKFARGNATDLHSRPRYHGLHTALWIVLPATLVIGAWISFGSGFIDGLMLDRLPSDLQPTSQLEERVLIQDLHRMAAGEESFGADERYAPYAMEYGRLAATGDLAATLLALSLALISGFWASFRVRPDHRARNKVERFMMVVLAACSVVAILTTLGIILSLLFESLRFFSRVPATEFLFGIQWSPQTAIRADQVGSSGAFGAIPLFVGTFLISAIAMVVAVPIGLMAAIYMTQYSSQKFRKAAKPALEILAGIPTVVYGFFAALTVAPMVRQIGESIGLHVASESALAAGLVMGVMIIPFMSSLTDDAITAVPQSMRDGSLALGATKSETIKQVLIPAALPGIVGAFLLSVSRAIGETMIVVMAAGLAANLTVNPLEAVTTVTVQIVALLTGDQEFDSAKTLSAFALGLILFIATLILNIIALRVVRRYRETYE